MARIVLYGSYGYTGNLIAEIAAKSDREVVLSGRDEEKLKEQSERVKIPYKTASLDSASDLDELLKDAEVVLHCAGPFVHTWKPMADACLRNGCHYLDITGEISVFESLKAMDRQFKEKKIMAMPGVGFDVVPTDCMAAWLHQQMPDATHLELAFQGVGSGVSRGTAKTMIENLGEGGAVREKGIIKKVPAAYKTREIKSGDKAVRVVSIPWGDISTAHFSTGIDNIVVYTAMPEKMIQRMKWLNRLKPIFKSKRVRNWLKRKVDSRPEGPNSEKRMNGRSLIWGEVRNEKGDSLEGFIETKEGYQLTAEMAWNIVLKVSSGNWSAGYQTPSKAYGADLILEIDGTTRNLKL
ncbi:MAG: hypothetical protein EA390_09830 [Balneolaceae bacterium]|nr:MAG: hypothetical protein EA390_09830 [Balneolaceae bacterium]